MPTKDQLATSNNTHSNTLCGNGGSGAATPLVFHSPDAAGQASGIASVNDTSSSDANSSAAVNKGPQAKAVQVTVSGCRFSNPA